MKQNFDISALRQTAAEIQGAVQPKSITPEMVGGLFSAIIEAQGEVIEALAALEREVVTVKVNGYDGQGRVSAAGAKVYVDVFSIGGVPTISIPRMELTADANGVVTFEVFKGYQYALFSKIDGLGASFQFSYEACQDNRDIELWNLPIGIFLCGRVTYYNENDDSVRGVPYVSSEYILDLVAEQSAMWDAAQNEIVDDVCYYGVLISTADTAFIIDKGTGKSENRLTWSGNRYSDKITPTLPALYYMGSEDYDAAVELARADFNGNLNTAKILAFCASAQAAEHCSDTPASYPAQCFLPSTGQLCLIRLNIDAVCTLLASLSCESEDDILFKPSDTFWSSSQHDEFSAYTVDLYEGAISDNYKSRVHEYVRAMSSFYFSV